MAKRIMRQSVLFILCLLVPFSSVMADKGYVPEKGSAELDKKGKKKKTGKATKIDPALPMVLIIGDSISIGYTGKVRAQLKGKANVLHNPGNSQGTTNGLAKIDAWLGDTQWDVIHFNFGLHDLKRVKKAGTAQNSNDPDDPYQADLKTYTSNMEQLVKRLKKTEAKLIFATTTPFPGGVSPYRAPEDAAKYNAAALKIMKANQVEVNDLYAAILPHLKTHQRPVNVHFLPKGSELLAKEVSAKVEALLAR
ncbi:SGNH/GDSL hydrolase family protein [Oceaniferula marina]|nr:SGNH/GDSL hydrolase family protein [Oceaniferula marina]